MPQAIPFEIRSQKYLSLITLRKNGTAVPTPVWFAGFDNKLYVMTHGDSAKVKRIRNNPQVRIAPSTIRGTKTGPEFPAMARVLPPEDWPLARRAIRERYWLARLPIWSKKNVYLEITMA